MNQLTLGNTVTDRVTGFTGTVCGLVDYISGCSQALVVPRVTADGAFRNGEWFDRQRLEIQDAPVLVLDNGPTPGFDAPPPRRS